MIRRFLHPGDRTIRDLPPDLVEEYAAARYVEAPWDCVCTQRCNCDKRPTEPPADRIAEAKAYLDTLKAGIAAAEKKTKA